jgi:OHCU decarboxylase
MCQAKTMNLSIAELDALPDKEAEKDFFEAFEGHPKIGDVNSLRTKYANTKALASGEQGAVNSANELTLNALNEGNRHYETKNGFIFIVCATGKSADEMLTLLTRRLKNDRVTEQKIAAEQQSLITAIRIAKYLMLKTLSKKRTLWPAPLPHTYSIPILAALQKAWQ